MGRFVNNDSVRFLGVKWTLLSYNLCCYCENEPILNIDYYGYAAINILFATIGAIVGWYFGDWVAKQIGYNNGWKYWAIRTGVVVGGAVLGWFAGALLTKIVTCFLKTNPSIVFSIAQKTGIVVFYQIMNFFGINPFSLASDSSKFIAIARLFNSTTVTLPFKLAIQLYDLSEQFGYRIDLDTPHGCYSWHIHLIGSSGRIINLHIQIVKSAWDYLWKLIE